MSGLASIYQFIQLLATHIVEELLRWRMMQQKSLSGTPKPGALDDIQEWLV